MKCQKFEPPKCPGCRRPLLDVYENEYWTYWFDEETGTYKGGLVDLDMLCPDCHMPLRDQFPEGVCNFQSKMPKPAE